MEGSLNAPGRASAEPRSVTLSDLKNSAAIAAERRPAGNDTDTSTVRTVRLMTDYIRSAADDPLVQRCADYAWRRFGMGSIEPAAIAWAVFWYVKHCIKFRLDEATMFRIGETDEQDLLIDPAVLVRMKDPSEDCDGFTMLEAAMLTVLGVPVVIAVVAVDPKDPRRWSHVFPCALLPGGRVMPLDASHGVGPGWMVPRSRISRWQAFDLNGEPVDVQPSNEGLHGYVRSGRGFGGLGQDECPSLEQLMGITDASDPCQNGAGYPDTSGGGGGSAGGSSTSNPVTVDITSLLNNLTTAGTKIVGAVEGQTTVTLPNGTVLTGPAASLASAVGASSFQSLIPILGIGLLAFVLISAMQKK